LVPVLVVTLLSGCPSAGLRDAREHFSAGARAETEQTLDDLRHYDFAEPERTQQQAVNEYRLAYETAHRLVRDRPGALRSDGTLGTAMMLEAYSLWRLLALYDGQEVPAGGDTGPSLTLDDLQSLVATIRTAADSTDPGQRVTLGTRDEVMLDAMPAFIEHERAMRAPSWEDKDSAFLSAYCLIGKAAESESTPIDHPIRAYLHHAQLQTVGAWRTAASSIPATDPRRTAQIRRVAGMQAYPVCGLKPWLEAGRGASTTRRVAEAQLQAISGTSVETVLGSCPTDGPQALPQECSAL
jgi:hypothetical protein